MTRSKVVFPFLILMVWGREGDKKKVLLSVGDAVLSYVFQFALLHLCAWCLESKDEGMQIQAQPDLLTLTRICRAYETISCLKGAKMLKVESWFRGLRNDFES